VEEKIKIQKDEEKRLKTIKDKLKDKISTWCNGRKLVFQMPSGYVKVNTETRKAPLNKSLIQEAASNIHMNEEQIELLINAIEELQEQKTTEKEKIQ